MIFPCKHYIDSSVSMFGYLMIVVTKAREQISQVTSKHRILICRCSWLSLAYQPELSNFSIFDPEDLCSCKYIPIRGYFPYKCPNLISLSCNLPNIYFYFFNIWIL